MTQQTRVGLVRRILAEHRPWVWPLGLLLAINVATLLLAVLPMSQSVRGAEGRARAASAEAAAAAAELKAVTATRDGRDGAARELAVFYRDVLPPDLAAARRLLQLRIAQLARTHNVTFARASASPDVIRDSSLTRLQVTAELAGRYDDVRAFLYAIETAKDFVVVESIALGEDRDVGGELNLSLTASTFFRTAPNVP